MSVAAAIPVEVSRHKCMIYDGHPSEQLAVVAPLLVDGLRENWRCLYLGNPEMVEVVGAALAARGVDTLRENQRGALILSSDRGHLRGGSFDPHAMVAMLCELIDDAVRDGFAGLCATGDMMWELGTEKNFERLMEYEALLEKVFQTKPLRGICQYDRRTVPAYAVRDALLTHRATYIGCELNRDNVFYVPPDLLLEGRDGSLRDRQGEWMCQQIIRVLNAERHRDQAMTALHESEAQQRRLAEALAEANRDLERRVVERTAQLEALNRELDAFGYSVSHDLRSPLRAIRGFARMLGEKNGPRLEGEGQRLLHVVEKSAARMDEMIEALLRLSHLDREELVRRPVDMNALVREVAEGLRVLEGDRPIEIEIGTLPQVDGDPALLSHVWQNLLSNALKYSRPRDPAVIRVGSRAIDREAVFHVQDNGVGFDMACADKLFGEFQRLHLTTDFEGTGVGLATVRRVVRRHGGRVWAESMPGEGATFYFTVPRDQGNQRSIAASASE